MSGPRKTKRKSKSVQDVIVPITTEKKCTKCGKIKILNEFPNRKERKNGKKSKCKACTKQYNDQYRKTRQQIDLTELIKKGIAKKCKVCHKKKLLSEFSPSKLGKYGTRSNCKKCATKATSVYYEQHKEEILIDKKARYKENPQIEINNQKRFRINNPGRASQIAMRWQKKNPEKVREIDKRYLKKKRSTVMGRLNVTIGNYIRMSLRGKKCGKHWEDIVGYTLQELKIHLEKLFLPGMTWNNRSEWHIDHKIPISYFHYTSYDDIAFKQCWALSNLQPMWAKDNMKKSNKIL